MLQFHPMHGAHFQTSRWLTALLTLCAVGLTQSTFVEAASPKSSEEQPIYTPPKKVTPRARVGGDVRGIDSGDPEVKALVPDHVGLTIKETPVVNWFVSKPTQHEVVVTLRDDRSPRAFQEKIIPSPKQPGIYSINFKELGFTLEPNVQYKWFVSVIRDADQHSNNLVAGGVIERCDLSECLEPLGAKLTCSLDTVVENAKAGFWYDAMGCLCNLIESDPTNDKLRRLRTRLLDDGGLIGVAEWDLRSLRHVARCPPQTFPRCTFITRFVAPLSILLFDTKGFTGESILIHL